MKENESDAFRIAASVAERALPREHTNYGTGEEVIRALVSAGILRLPLYETSKEEL